AYVRLCGEVLLAVGGVADFCRAAWRRHLAADRFCPALRVGLHYRAGTHGHPPVLECRRQYRSTPASERSRSSHAIDRRMYRHVDLGGPHHAIPGRDRQQSGYAECLYQRCAHAEPGPPRRTVGGSAMKRLLSWLYLPTMLLGLWLLLNDSLSPGNIALGGVLALFFGWASQALRPVRARPRKPLVALKLLWRVAVDVFNSNLEVARIIWLGPRDIAPGFLKIPIKLKDPHGLAVLSCIVTYTPGTVWAEF